MNIKPTKKYPQNKRKHFWYVNLSELKQRLNHYIKLDLRENVQQEVAIVTTAH